MLLSAVSAFADTWVVRDDSTRTYLDENGRSTTGWMDDGGDRYHLSEGGVRKTGWCKTKNSWYYSEEDDTLTVGR